MSKAFQVTIPVGDGPLPEVEPDILLRDFAPVCDAVLPRTEVKGFAFPLVDVHTHWGRLILGDEYEGQYDTAEIVAKLRAQGVTKVVNIDAEFGPHCDRILKKLSGFEDFFHHVGTVDIARFEEPDFEQQVYATMKAHKERGVLGIKIWKNTGLGFRDKQGNYLRLDDKRLDCVWQSAAQFGLVVMVHVADPPGFFKPIDAHNERYEELCDHPEWSFMQPGMPSYQELIGMFERVIAGNPATTFIGCHLICAEDLGRMGEWLHKYPNLYMDIADRIYEVGRAPYSARRFFTEFQDRLLFGSDSFATQCEFYPYYARFLETFDEYFDYNTDPSSKGRWKIYGIGLDSGVLEKLYHKNAGKVFGIKL